MKNISHLPIPIAWNPVSKKRRIELHLNFTPGIDNNNNNEYNYKLEHGYIWLIILTYNNS